LPQPAGGVHFEIGGFFQQRSTPRNGNGMLVSSLTTSSHHVLITGRQRFPNMRNVTASGRVKTKCYRPFFANESSMKQLILSLLLCGIASATPDSPQWKIIKTKYPTADTVVAGFNVLDFGALGDGKMDCTGSFQQAMDNMRNASKITVSRSDVKL
jgi:hypothetical protein